MNCRIGRKGPRSLIQLHLTVPCVQQPAAWKSLLVERDDVDLQSENRGFQGIVMSNNFRDRLKLTDTSPRCKRVAEQDVAKHGTF